MTLTAASSTLRELHQALTTAHFEGVALYDAEGGAMWSDGAPLAVEAAAWILDEAVEPEESVVHQGRQYLVQTLEAYGERIGRLIWQPTGPVSDAELNKTRLIRQLVQRIGTLDYELDNLSSELAETYESIHLLCDVAQASTRTTSAQQLCQVLLEDLVRQVKSRGGAILMAESHQNLTDSWKIAATVGELPDWRAGGRVSPVGILQQIFESGQGVLVDSVAQTNADQDPLLDQATHSVLAAPLLAGDQVHGVLVLVDRLDEESQAFDSRDRQIVDATATQGAAMILGMRLAEYSKEMEIGRKIQQSLLPSEIPQPVRTQVAGLCAMARVVGGDFYDVGLTEDGVFQAVIADVSGHDLGSALLMSSARAQFHSELRHKCSLGEAASRLNAQLYKDLSGAGLFLTYFLIQWDPTSETLQYASGGHNPALLIQKNGTEVHSLEATGMPAGVVPVAKIGQEHRGLEAGDLCLLYTDGLTEAARPDGEMFGEERLARVLQDNHSLSATEILSRIEAEIRHFTGEQVLQDDGTAVLVKVLAPTVDQTE